MLVKKLDLKIVNMFAKNLKTNSMVDVDIDLLWFCNDVAEKTDSIVAPINDDIESLEKWYKENVANIQSECSEHNEDGSIKTVKGEDGHDYLVFKDGKMEEFKDRMAVMTKTLNEKNQDIEAKLQEEVDVDIMKISKACLPKNMKPLEFDSIVKFVER